MKEERKRFQEREREEGGKERDREGYEQVTVLVWDEAER